MRQSSPQSGYIGILLILLGTAGMLFLFMKMYFTPIKSTSSTNTGAAPTTQFDNYMSDINAAKIISNQQKVKADETNRILNSVQ